ncbi:MAG: PilZ domain-containing protein [Planctomycetota bacterium]
MFRARISTPEGSDRRQARRTDAGGIYSDHGRLIDLSTRGCRLRTVRRWAEGRRRVIRLRSGSIDLQVVARCVWCQQDRLMSHVVGLAFDEVEAHRRELLTTLVESARPIRDDEPPSVAA